MAVKHPVAYTPATKRSKHLNALGDVISAAFLQDVRLISGKINNSKKFESVFIDPTNGIDPLTETLVLDSNGDVSGRYGDTSRPYKTLPYTLETLSPGFTYVIYIKGSNQTLLINKDVVMARHVNVLIINDTGASNNKVEFGYSTVGTTAVQYSIGTVKSQITFAVNVRTAKLTAEHAAYTVQDNPGIISYSAGENIIRFDGRNIELGDMDLIVGRGGNDKITLAARSCNFTRVHTTRAGCIATSFDNTIDLQINRTCTLAGTQISANPTALLGWLRNVEYDTYNSVKNFITPYSISTLKTPVNFSGNIGLTVTNVASSKKVGFTANTPFVLGFNNATMSIVNDQTKPPKGMSGTVPNVFNVTKTAPANPSVVGMWEISPNPGQTIRYRFTFGIKNASPGGVNLAMSVKNKNGTVLEWPQDLYINRSQSTEIYKIYEPIFTCDPLLSLYNSGFYIEFTPSGNDATIEFQLVAVYVEYTANEALLTV